MSMKPTMRCDGCEKSFVCGTVDVRAKAKEQGWICFRGLDICPDCLETILNEWSAARMMKLKVSKPPSPVIVPPVIVSESDGIFPGGIKKRYAQSPPEKSQAIPDATPDALSKSKTPDTNHYSPFEPEDFYSPPELEARGYTIGRAPSAGMTKKEVEAREFEQLEIRESSVANRLAFLDRLGKGECLESIAEANAEAVRLRQAIRKHRDYRGDHRCWMDDEELYKVLPEGYTPPERDTKVEKENCDRYIACRHNPNTEYVSPQLRIEELEEEVRNLGAQLVQARMQIQGLVSEVQNGPRN